MTVATAQPGQRILLRDLFTPPLVRRHLLPRERWRPYPTGQDRPGWEALPAEVRARVLAEAEAHRGTAWPELPATLFLEYRRDGNRSRYEARHQARRGALIRLVLGECVEGGGRFLDDIVNGVWALCEESFWGVPAHSFSPRFPQDPPPTGRYPSAGLPDTAYPVVDLFAAETGALLAWTHSLLGEALARELPVVTDRIVREVEARILGPYRAIDEWNWLGKRRRPVNNWNPWIHSNVLAMNLLLEPDPAAREATVLRIVEGLDAFLEGYHDDGGCDEGTSYWGRAGASLYDCLALLASASDGALDGFQLPLVREIGRYIYRMHIGGPWFVNFADGAAKVALEGYLTYDYGKRIREPRLMAQGAHARQHAREGSMRRASIGRALPALFGWAEFAAADPTPPLVREAWLDGIQVLTAREREGSADGLFLAAKGGHNAESHNHNDVGQFIVALDGQPVLIDVGVETYTSKTFSGRRYEIWTMQSDYHNLPLIDGQGQGVGREFAARGVAAEVADDRAGLSLDLAPAYPAAAGVRRWTRTLRLERDEEARVVLEEDYDLERQPGNLALHLMSAGAPDASEPGVVRCSTPTRPLAVRYDPRVFSATTEAIEIEDARLKPVWGERVHRIILAATAPGVRGNWTLTIAPEPA
jgi:hypothetical protein